MRIDITRQPLSVVMVQFFLLMALFWCRLEFSPSVAEATNLSSGFALSYFIDSFAARFGLLNNLLITVIVFINAMLVTRIITRNMILGMRTYIPSLIYLTASIGIFMSSNPSGYIASMFVIQGSYYLIRGFRRLSSFDYMFKGGLFIGLATLLCFELVILLIAVIIALMLFRRSTREAIVAFTGLILPILTCSYVYWAIGYDFSHVCTWGWESLRWFENYGLIVAAVGIPQLVFISILTLTIFLSLGTFIINAHNMRNRAYRIFIYFIWLLLISIVIFVLPCRSSIGYSIVAIAASVIAPYYFVKNNSHFSTLLYSSLIISVIVANIITITLY